MTLNNSVGKGLTLQARVLEEGTLVGLGERKERQWGGTSLRKGLSDTQARKRWAGSGASELPGTLLGALNSTGSLKTSFQVSQRGSGGYPGRI